MNLELARKIKNICYVVASLTAAASFVLKSQSTLFLILAVVIMAVGIVVSVAFYRCPHCNTPLPTNGKMPDRCPHCGERLQ